MDPPHDHDPISPLNLCSLPSQSLREEDDPDSLVSLSRNHPNESVTRDESLATSRFAAPPTTTTTSSPKPHHFSHGIPHETLKEGGGTNHVEISKGLLLLGKGEDEEEEDARGESTESTTTAGTGRYLAIQILPEKRLNASIGACLFDTNHRTLYVLGKSTASYGDTAFLLGLVRSACGPCESVIVSTKTREADLEELRRQHDGKRLQIRPAAWFEYTRAAHCLSRMLGDNPYALGANIDLSNRASVEAAGAVIIQAEQTTEALEIGSGLNVEMFDLERFMCIDATSLTSLDIVKAEEHPSQIRGRGRAKEGFSLLALLDRAKSPSGSATLRRWVSRPLARREEIEARHDAVGFFLDPRRQELRVGIAKLLKNVQDVPRSFLRIKRCEATYKDWIAVCESLMNVELALTSLKSELMEIIDEVIPSVLIDIVSGTCEKLTATLQRAVDVFDWEATRAMGRLVPHEGVNEELDRARARVASLPTLLERESKMEESKSGGTFRFIPAIGFVIGVGLEPQTMRRRLDRDPEFVFHFEAHMRQSQHNDGELLMGDEVEEDDHNNNNNKRARGGEKEEEERQSRRDHLIRFYKNHRARALDAEVGDPFAAVTDLEGEIVRGVELTLLDAEPEVLLAAHRASELDALICFAEVSMDFRYVRPIMRDEPHVLRIKGARHPLLDQLAGGGGEGHRFVPNDVEVRRGTTVTIITGPNYSGKSVILKTVVLLCVMAQIGCFVPAEEAEMGIVDRVFTRLNSLETVGSAQLQSESSFSIDVQQIALMLKNCTPNSLLVVDEFGKGTASLDGISLLAATVRYLTRGGVGEIVPRTFITTHLLEIFELFSSSSAAGASADTPFSQIQRCEMQVEFQVGSRVPVPLFRMRRVDDGEAGGVGRESYGVACARRAGVKESVCTAAERAVEENDLRLFDDEFLVERFKELRWEREEIPLLFLRAVKEAS